MAIEAYFDKLKAYPCYYKNENFSEVSDEIRCRFENGIIPVERKEKTNLSFFEKEFGYKLPDEIAEYINLFWHASISGYHSVSECIVLFPVLKKRGDTCDEILFYNNGLMNMAKNWMKIGDIRKLIPIGWLGYSGGYILYGVETGKIFVEDMDADNDGVINEVPIAGSLRELIRCLEIKTQ